VAMMPRRAIASRILRAVAEKHGVTVDGITGPRRWPEYVAARREAARRIYGEVQGASLPFVGRCLNRHHTTVLALLGRIGRGREAPVLVAVP
jgi:chromosomal replication initiation ATPase DnaA